MVYLARHVSTEVREKEMSHLNEAISREIQAATRGLPLYRGGPGVDYTDAPVAYAVNVTVVWRTSRPQALLVQRASGYGKIGSWSGVSGFVDTPHDPRGIGGRRFDPVNHTIRTELEEECGLGDDVLTRLAFHLGARFEVKSHNGGRLHVLPVLAVYRGAQQFAIRLNPDELSAHRWVRLGQVAALPDLNPGYRAQTLPRILEVLRATTT